MLIVELTRLNRVTGAEVQIPFFIWKYLFEVAVDELSTYFNGSTVHSFEKAVDLITVKVLDITTPLCMEYVL